MCLAVMLVIVAESMESMLSLTYFSKSTSVEASIAENNSWLSEIHDYDNVPFEHPEHPTKNQANLFLMKYSEFHMTYHQMMQRQFPLQVAKVALNLHAIIITVSLIKIVLALLFAGGERRAGKVFVWFFYPLRLIFYYNPFSIYN
jgi:hypothetical protein